VLLKAEWLVSIYGGAEGLHPVFLTLRGYETEFTIFLLIGGVIIWYLSVCSLVAEDSGSLPTPLLFSRPVSRGVFLAVGFAIRFPIAATLGFLLPFAVGYAQNVSVVGGVVEPVVTRYMTMGDWYSMAWNGFFWEITALYLACLLGWTSIAVLAATVSRRGLITLPLATGLTFTLCAMGGLSMYAYVQSGDAVPFFFSLTPQYYLFGAVLSTPGMYNPINNRLLTIPQGTLILLVYGLIVVTLSALLYRRRGAVAD
jgi:hypothetical protein